MPSITIAEAAHQLSEAGITGPHKSHTRSNTIGNIRALVAGDPDKCFGMAAPSHYTDAEVLAFLAELTGCSSDIDDRDGQDTVDPARTVAGIVSAAQRLAGHARTGGTMAILTGHPTGMLEHHIRVADSFQAAGGKLLLMCEDRKLPSVERRAEVVYTGGVGCLSNGASLEHTHSPAAMEALLDNDVWPDIVFGDHGFAGAAVQRGIPAIAVMDINDPALAVAWAENRDVTVIPMDDNRPPRLYEPSWRLFAQELAGERLR